MATIASTLTEAALAIANHGFADEFGNVDAPEWNNVLCTVSSVLLRNVGEHRMAEDFARIMGGAQYVAWVRINSDGIKILHTYAACGTPAEDSIFREWDAAESAQTADTV